MKPNPNYGRIILCKVCNKQEEHKAKGMCKKCYKKAYRQPTVVCKHCGKTREHKAFGLCGPCHTKLYHYQKTKDFNYRRYHNIPAEVYKEVTKMCISCGFDKVVNLHHLDMNRLNNTRQNLVGLCPNHHKMIHDYRYSKEVVKILKEKGYNAKEKVL